MAQVANKSNPKRTIVALNGSAGAFVTISASKFARYVEIAECPADGGAFTGTFTAQGLNYELPDDNFATQHPLAAGAIFQLGQKELPSEKAIGQPGWTTPDNQAVPATIYMKAKSATVTATQVEVREWS